MSFKPENANRPAGNYEQTNFPVPRAGSRKARISLIVDMGIQNREPFEDPQTGELREQKPCQQVAVFADLVADTVDYGGTIGKQHYRLPINKSFMGVVQGINFVGTPPKDAKGAIIKGKPYVLHPANLLTKLAKACGCPEIIESLDLEPLLNKAFMAQVEVKETVDKNGKVDKEGKPVVYKNVNFRGAAEVPEDDDGNKLPVAELANKALCITFKTAKKEDIKWIRAGLLNQIKLANNYAGSQMQKAIEAYEAEKDEEQHEEYEEAEEAPAKPVAKPPAKKVAAKKPAPVPEDDDDDMIPF